MTEIGPVTIELVAEGIEKITSQFASIEKRLAEMEKKASTLRTKRVSDEQKAANAIAKAAEKQSKEVLKTAEQEAKRRENLRDQSAKMAGKYAEQEANKEISEAKRAANEQARLARQSANAQIAEAKRVAEASAKYRRNLLGAGAGAVGGMFGRAASLATTGLALGAGLETRAALNRELAISQNAQQAALVTHVPGHPEEAVSAKELADRARVLGKQFNVHPEDILTSQKELMSKSSMGASVLPIMPEIIKLAKAENTGQDPVEFQNELARSAGIMIKQGMDKDKVMTILRGIVGQGRSAGGTVEFSEMANVIPRLTSKAGLYEGNQEGNALKQISMFQAAYQATGDVAEAATGVERIADDVIKDSNKGSKSKMKKLLGHSLIRNGRIMDPMEWIPELFQKTGGDVDKLENAGLNVRSNRVVLGYLDTFQKAEAQKKGSGGEAVKQSMIQTVGSQLSVSDVAKDLADKMATPAERWEKAVNELTDAFIPLVPVVIDLMTELGKLAPTIKDVLQLMASHPWATVFAGLGASITKAILGEIISAGIASTIKSLIPGAAGAAGTAGVGAASLLEGSGPLLAVAGYAAAQSYVRNNLFAAVEEGQAPNVAFGHMAAAMVVQNNPNGIGQEIKDKRAIVDSLSDKYRSGKGLSSQETATLVQNEIEIKDLQAAEKQIEAADKLMEAANHLLGVNGSGQGGKPTDAGSGHFLFHNTGSHGNGMTAGDPK